MRSPAKWPKSKKNDFEKNESLTCKVTCRGDFLGIGTVYNTAPDHFDHASYRILSAATALDKKKLY